MSRVQFVETVVLPLGPGGSLVPVPGIGTIPLSINEIDGSEIAQVPAYAQRTGNAQVSSLATDASGTISYWLDAGDYNIHFQDQQNPPRIPPFTRGFNAAIVDRNEIILGAQSLLQFTGDYKFSHQTADHGILDDGSFEWLHVVSDIDGNGRLVDHTVYQGLWQQLGSPALNFTGQFHLPNLSGRTLVASGLATGLSSRQLLDMVGVETHVLTIGQMPTHNHPPQSGGTTTYVTDETGGTLATAGADVVAGNNREAETAFAGGDQAHPNMQPSGVLNLFIKT